MLWLLFTALAFASPDLGAPGCKAGFAGLGYHKVSIPNLRAEPMPYKDPKTIERVSQMAKELILKNAELIQDHESWLKVPRASEFVHFELTSETVSVGDSKYVKYNFSGVGTTKDGARINFNFDVRSNGNVAFLDRTWAYRNNKSTTVKKYKMAYFDGDTIKTELQGEAILQSLPEQMVLARNMSGKEYDRWVTGEPYFPSTMYGNRVHFMPDTSRFQTDYEPYYVKFTKEELLDFFRKSKLEVNVYEENTNMDLSNVPLNVEFVFMGDKGVAGIAPYMQKQLKEQGKKQDRAPRAR